MKVVHTPLWHVVKNLEKLAAHQVMLLNIVSIIFTYQVVIKVVDNGVIVVILDLSLQSLEDVIDLALILTQPFFEII